jgi:hypothetical protein
LTAVVFANCTALTEILLCKAATLILGFSRSIVPEESNSTTSRTSRVVKNHPEGLTTGSVFAGRASLVRSRVIHLAALAYSAGHVVCV